VHSPNKLQSFRTPQYRFCVQDWGILSTFASGIANKRSYNLLQHCRMRDLHIPLATLRMSCRLSEQVALSQASKIRDCATHPINLSVDISPAMENEYYVPRTIAGYLKETT
jgi:hypothetical protein